MPTNTYVALDKVTVTSSVTSITLNMGSTLSQAYTDLVLVANTIVPTGNTFPECSLRFNGDTGSNYSSTYLLGLGSGSGVSGRASNITYADCGYLTSNSGNPNTRIINIMNYSNTTTNKTVLVRGSSDNAGQVIAYANLWRNTAAITSITVFTQGGTYAAGSTFSLYGIANADNFVKATGGIITEDATYTYHTFGSTGTFTPKQSLTADILVVAGGGGGSRGGGGAGGVAYYASQSLTATGYTCTVGAGGAGSTDSEGSNAAKGTSGVNSSFTGLTAAVGGGGAGADFSSVNNGLNGGSGGGSGYGRPSSDTRATGTSGQGSSGGLALSDSTTYTSGGGGGGAGAQGGDVNSGSKTGGIGGVGITTYSSWGTTTNIGENVSGTYYLAGGGGGGGNTYAGGTGGYGGGGAGKNTGASNNGLSNTGGGGGGNADGVTCGNGGSGVVIVRYLKA